MTSTNSRQLAQTWPFARYKSYEGSLRKAAAQWFVDKGYNTDPRMKYCLDSHDLWPKNIICDDVAAYIREEQKRLRGENSFPLHKYLHHGLSSQAMAFNLVGPLVVRRDLEPLKIALEKGGVHWPMGEVTAEFEHDDRQVFNEDSGQPTSIDVMVSGASTKLFIEVKLSEREFGGCSVFSSGDCEGRNPYPSALSDCYLHHIGRLYWQHMDEHGFSNSTFSTGPICPFTSYYQFFREVLFAFANKGTFVLLHDERNPAFLKSSKGGTSQGGLWPFLVQSIPPEKRNQVARITVQDVVQAIEESGRHEDWVGEFKRKYGLVSL